MAVSNSDKSTALLVSTRDGTYPESEEVLTANIDGPTLRSSLQRVGEAKNELETDIRNLSQKTSSDVDGWITKARQLQEDISHSRRIAQEIVRDYEEVRNSSARLQDAKAKLELLQEETSFNHSITSSLESLSSVDRDLNQAESTLAAGKLVELAAIIKQLSSVVLELPDGNAKEINLARFARIQDGLVERLAAALNTMVEFQKSSGQRRVMVNHTQHEVLHVPLQRLLEALETLDSLEGPIRNISGSFHRKICHPILSRSSEAVTGSIDEASHNLALSSNDGVKGPSNVIDCLSVLFIFLHTCFPRTLGSAIGNTLSDEIVEALIRDWLTPAIPLGLPDLHQFNSIQTRVVEFADLIRSYQWSGHKALTAWVDKVPQVWLERRRASSLDAVRKALNARRGPKREVQRIERQNVSEEDEAFGLSDADPWNTSRNGKQPDITIDPATTLTKEEDDLSGWNFDEDTEDSSSAPLSPIKANGNAEDTTDGWGWGEGNPDENASDDLTSRTGRANSGPTGNSDRKHEVTLMETYMITDIPDHLLEIISGQVRDAEQMKAGKYAALEDISASAGLLSLPTSILAIFRAIAPSHYSTTLASGNMHLYNDCIYANEKLRDLAKSTSLAQLRYECDVLERFARSAYAREMDVQRTVLRDLLDGAQGFDNCTRFPYSAECENAVSSTIARLRSVHDDWSAILSRSALLQSIGSLLSTVMEKIVKDVEDMEDISEPESQRLAAFCSKFSALEDLFMVERSAAGDGAGEEALPLTAAYVSNWLRFQYLSNILESSLVDIKYLWTEGELSMEFTADEVVELIKALFAESSHRRSAIAEIRRSRP